MRASCYRDEVAGGVSGFVMGRRSNGLFEPAWRQDVLGIDGQAPRGLRQVCVPKTLIQGLGLEACISWIGAFLGVEVGSGLASAEQLCLCCC